MRVLILCTSLYGGGAEKIISLLSLGLVKPPLIAVFNRKPKEHPYGGHLINLSFPPTKNPIKKVINAIRRIWKVRYLKRRMDPDVVISFMQAPNILNVLTKRNEQVVVSIRNNDSLKYSLSSNYFEKIEHYLMKATINRADKIVSVSKELNEIILREYRIKDPDKLIAIQNGCDLEDIQIKCNEKVTEFDELFSFPTIINVGKLEVQKGQNHLLKIFNEIRKRVDNVKLIILGQGRLRQELIDYAFSIGLSPYSQDKDFNDSYDVYFLGFQPNPYKFIAKATVFAFPSLYEGFPNALIEAMACGVPVVSSNCKTGPSEVLVGDSPEMKFGFLIDTFDIWDPNRISDVEKEWADVLVKILMDSKLRDSFAKKSLERVKSFDHKSLINQWLERLELGRN